MHTPTHRACTAIVAAIIVLTGCSDDEAVSPPPPPPIPTSSPSPSAASPASSSPSAAPSPSASPSLGVSAGQLSRLLVVGEDLPELTGSVEDADTNLRNQRLSEAVVKCAGPDAPVGYGKGILRGEAFENADSTVSVESSAQESSAAKASAHQRAHQSPKYLQCVVDALTAELGEAAPGSKVALRHMSLPAPAPNISVAVITGTITLGEQVIPIWSQDYLVTHTLSSGVAETNFSVSVTGQTEEAARAAATRVGSRVLAALAKRAG